MRGSRLISANPSRAIVANQTAMIGPNATPTRPVPKRWSMNSSEQDDDRQRNDEPLERRRRDVQPFDRAEHGDRRRDHPVAVEERRAEQSQRDEESCAAASPSRVAPAEG